MLVSMRQAAVVLALGGVLALGVGHAAGAHDSLAPPGAPHVWLPAEPWIHRHWVPFDEQALKGALGLRGRGLEAYLYDDHHVLADLARARGMDLGGLADRLVSPWRSNATPEHVAVMRARTLSLLTQGHLAQHVFFHVYHGIGVEVGASWLFGISA